MKSFNLTSLTLVAVVAVQLLSTEAVAGYRFKETILTTKQEAIKDPYFQLISSKIEELTEEEALEFSNEEIIFSTPNKGILAKGLTIPNIPPRPPEAKVTEPVGTGIAGGSSSPIMAPTGFFDGIIMVVDKLIAIGQKIMPTIEKGKAVVTNNPMSAVSVLPRIDSTDPVVHDMGGWTIPVTKHYKISYSNGFGSEVVAFIYSITYQYNGSYGGEGKYLTGIRASARNIIISWGFDLDASSQLIQISNIGTAANVIAGATIEISYTVKNWTRTITTNEAFFVAGDGRLFKLD